VKKKGRNLRREKKKKKKKKHIFPDGKLEGKKGDIKKEGGGWVSEKKGKVCFEDNDKRDRKGKPPPFGWAIPLDQKVERKHVTVLIEDEEVHPREEGLPRCSTFEGGTRDGGVD